MPAWWKGKSKSKSKANSASSSPRNFDHSVFSPAKNKSNITNTNSDPSRVSDGYPLPRPVSLPTGSCTPSAASSLSSLGSSEDTPDQLIDRYSDPVNTLRGSSTLPEPVRIRQVAVEETHRRFSETSVSPRRSGAHNIFAPGPTSSPSGSSHYNYRHRPGSPCGGLDGMKSPPHPLPLPPGSPSTSNSNSNSNVHQSQWKKGKLLGRGTFGQVYLGFNCEGGQMCAIKEVTVISDDKNSKECLRQLNQEIVLLSQLKHPNIVRYYGSELADDTLSVYLEYVSGGSIHKLLQEYGAFKEPVVRNYTRQILSGLAYLHQRNTVHRDIKGANILVGPNGEVKLADFGMAKHTSSHTSIRSFKGSPYWMAPEVIMNGNGYNLSVDIWSLGCTVIEMATSKPPWSQFEGVAALFKIANSREIEIPDHFSAEGKDFLKLCLRRDPATRPTAAELLDHRFVQISNSNSNSAMRNASPSPSLSPNRRNKQIQNGTEFSSRRSLSPLRDIEIGARDISGFPSANYHSHRNISDPISIRTNMSLPVSPCSSPLRQFKNTNTNCLPSPVLSPTRPVNYNSPINRQLSPTRLYNNSNNNNTARTTTESWAEINQLNFRNQSPFSSPKRLL